LLAVTQPNTTALTDINSGGELTLPGAGCLNIRG
jgi:hypothetical protein